MEFNSGFKVLKRELNTVKLLTIRVVRITSYLVTTNVINNKADNNFTVSFGV